MKTIFKPFFNYISLSLALMLLGVTACSPTTQITGSWKSPEATEKQYNNVIVAAFTDNVVARQTVENDLQAQLAQRGISATKSIDIFPPAMMRDSGSNAEALMQKIQGDGYDAILTATVVDEKTETRYVQGGNQLYSPIPRFGYYGSFIGYYSHWAPIVHNPGYYREDQVYFLETNLYDAETDKLLWSAQSRSYNPSDLERFSRKFSELTVSTMQEQNLIN